MIEIAFRVSLIMYKSSKKFDILPLASTSSQAPNLVWGFFLLENDDFIQTD